MTRTIVAMFSGGLDSLAMLHLLLTDLQYADSNIHVHHVNIRNVEHRSDVEAKVVEEALQWFKDNGYRPFTTSFSTIEYDSYNGQFLSDTDVTYFFAGYITSCKPNSIVAFGVNAGDYHGSTLATRLIRSREIGAAFGITDRLLPVSELSKLELYNLLPVGLKDKFWSCRIPKYIDNVATPCNRCRTCKELANIGVLVAPKPLIGPIVAPTNCSTL